MSSSGHPNICVALQLGVRLPPGLAAVHYLRRERSISLRGRVDVLFLNSPGAVKA